jgi:hypothetical protein
VFTIVWKQRSQSVEYAQGSFRAGWIRLHFGQHWRAKPALKRYECNGLWDASIFIPKLEGRRVQLVTEGSVAARIDSAGN